MARKKREIEGQLSFFDLLDDLEVEQEGVEDGESTLRRDQEAGLQSGDGSVDGPVGQRSDSVAGAVGGDALSVDAEPEVRPGVSADRDDNVGGRGDGSANVPDAQPGVSEVSGSDRGGQADAGGPGSADGDRGPGIASVADHGAVASGPTTPGLGPDGGRLEHCTGEGADTGDPAVSDAVYPGSGSEDSGRVLTGQPVDWAGGSARPSGFQARLQANLAALETLEELEAGYTYATQDQQQRLAGWSSWGALPEVFDPTSDRVDDAI